MGRARHDPQMAAADARVDQIIADVTDGARSDVPAWVELGRKVNGAANTRVAAAASEWTEEEKYRLIRLADVGHAVVTARLLGRKV